MPGKASLQPTWAFSHFLKLPACQRYRQTLPQPVLVLGVAQVTNISLFSSILLNLICQKSLIQVIYRLISLVVAILSLYISQNAVLNLKCIQFLFVNYISIKMKEVKQWATLQNINKKNETQGKTLKITIEAFTIPKYQLLKTSYY